MQADAASGKNPLCADLRMNDSGTAAQDWHNLSYSELVSRGLIWDGINPPLPPRLFSLENASSYLGVSQAAFAALSVRAKKLSPKIRRYDRYDLDAITPAQIRRARRAVGELTPKRQMAILDVVRAYVFSRDGRKCRYCGDEEGRMTLDHVTPVSRGGSDDSANLVVACMSCNSSKGQKALEEWRAAKCGTT